MSSYTRGKEPRCPDRHPGCVGIIRNRGSKRCIVCERAIRKGMTTTVLPEVPESCSESHSESSDVAEITKVVGENVRTLEDLVRVCEIDLTIWDIERWVANKWEMGFKIEDGTNAQPLFQIKVWLRRKSTHILTMQKLQQQLVDDIRAEVQGAPSIYLPREYKDGDWLFEFSPFDLHMGKYAWEEETVTNYDVDIAEDLFNASLDFLLTRALRLTEGKLARVLCVFGNDVCHVDSKRGETTGGTPMDFDGRYAKVYRRICQVHRRAVDILRSVAPVDIKIVPGNHDELTSFHLGEVLSTRYEDDPHVSVDNTAKLRKYYAYGVNLFGFAHGHAEKVTELPLTMAREQPELWAQCPSREWHIGHKHISEKWEVNARTEQDFFSDKGVRIRRLTSISAHDAWHTKHAYMDRRACEAFVFHKTAGFTDHLSFNVDHFTGKALQV